MSWFGHDSTMVGENLNFASIEYLEMPITSIFLTLNLVVKILPRLSQPHLLKQLPPFGMNPPFKDFFPAPPFVSKQKIFQPLL